MIRLINEAGDTVLGRAWRAFHDPHFRCQHSRIIHAARITIGVLIAFAITAGFGIPDGTWTPVSLLIVIASLQHHGNVRARAVERSLGTAIGACVGILAILEQSYLGATPLTWGFIALFCGACAYYAVGKGGYTALLSALTVVIVAGYGTDPLVTGLWRTVNVLLGISIALALSFAAPIYATWFWRFQFAEALGECAAIYARMGREAPEQLLQEVTGMSAVLQQLRPLMPWVSRESGIPVHNLEAIQRHLRIFISATELLLTSQMKESEPAAVDTLQIRQKLLNLQKLLATDRLDQVIFSQDITATELENSSSWATLSVSELDHLGALLAGAPALWKV